MNPSRRCSVIGVKKTEFTSSFSQKWGIPHLTLTAYLRFWCVVCYAVTLWLILFKKEVRETISNCMHEWLIHFQDKEPASDADMSIKAVYKTIWTICQLKRIPISLFNIQDLIVTWQMFNFS